MRKILIIAALMISAISCASNPLTREEKKVAKSLAIEAVRVELSDDMFSGFIALKNTSYESIYDYVEFKAAVSYRDYYGVFMYAFQPICDDSSPFAPQETRPFLIIPAVNSQSSATIKDHEWNLGYRLIVSYRVNGGEWIQVVEYDFPKAKKWYGDYVSTLEIGEINILNNF